METQTHTLTTEQYALLYRRAFARLDDLSLLAQQAMGELEELQLSMAEEERPSNLIPLLPRKTTDFDLP